MIEVTRFTGATAEWDAFARQQAGFTHFHLHGWKRVMEQALRHETHYLGARGESGALDGILPLVRVRSLVFGHYLVSMPFLNYGGPLGGDRAIAALVAGAVKVAERDGVKLLELRSRRALPIPLRASHRKVTVVLRLPDTTEELMGRFPAKLRSQVRRPAKDGITTGSARTRSGRSSRSSPGTCTNSARRPRGERSSRRFRERSASRRGSAARTLGTGPSPRERGSNGAMRSR
jgi:hypothetical protein